MRPQPVEFHAADLWQEDEARMVAADCHVLPQYALLALPSSQMHILWLLFVFGQPGVNHCAQPTALQYWFSLKCKMALEKYPEELNTSAQTPTKKCE